MYETAKISMINKYSILHWRASIPSGEIKKIYTVKLSQQGYAKFCQRTEVFENYRKCPLTNGKNPLFLKR